MIEETHYDLNRVHKLKNKPLNNRMTRTKIVQAPQNNK